jgi:hypothetical protein
MSYTWSALGILTGAFCFVPPAGAQANVPQLRGEYGIGSGTQKPPGGYAEMIYSTYEPEHVIAVNENATPRLQPISDLIAAQFTYTFKAPVLGGHYSMTAQVPWSDFAITVPDIQGSVSWGFSDVYVQPARLGWTYPMADVVAGVGVYMPTGRFGDDATSNAGFGMWSFETSAGSTVYLGPSKQSSASALVLYQVQSHVRSSDKRAGDVLSVAGGVGHTIIPHTGQIGLAYYAMWKLTPDQNFDVSPEFAGKNRMFGAGPEVTVPFPLPPGTGSLTLRYLIEFACRSSTQGNTIYLSVSIGPPHK